MTDLRDLAPAVMVGAGLAAATVGILERARRRRASLRALLDLSWDNAELPPEAVTEYPSGVIAGQVAALVGRVDNGRRLRAALERADLPLRPEEYVALTVAAALVVACVTSAVTRQPVIGLGAGAAVAALAWRLPSILIRRRRLKLLAQLPEAFSIVAASISAGHTFLRSIQMLRQETDAPLSDELNRVVTETMLGVDLVDALEKMADRNDIDDLRWAVHAVRVQQSTGGRLAGVLHTMAEFMLARQEVRREVQVLTAEGRVSAYVLVGLPVFLALSLQVSDPSYLAPFFRGVGLVILVGLAGVLAMGFIVIRRMVDIKV